MKQTRNAGVHNTWLFLIVEYNPVEKKCYLSYQLKMLETFEFHPCSTDTGETKDFKMHEILRLRYILFTIFGNECMSSICN